MAFEYKVVPAPTRGKKAKGLKTRADRFAHALAEVMNELAAEGWDYLRTDTLPSEERQGLTGRTTVFQNMLVFRRSAAATENAGADAGPETPAIDGVVDAIAETHAPKLPSAAEAQDAPEAPSARIGVAGRRGVAAE